MYSDASEKNEFIIIDDSEKYVPNIISKYEYIRQKREHIEYIKKINILSQYEFYLVISEVNEPLMELDFITLDGIVSPLRYILSQIMTEKNREKKYYRDFGISVTEWLTVRCRRR